MTDKQRRRKERHKENKRRDALGIQGERLGLRNAYGITDPTPMQAVNNMLKERND